MEIRGIEKKKANEDIKKMLILYKGIDHFDENLLVSQRQFFPANPKERTPERMLEGFQYIYSILRDASERHELKALFDSFWDDRRADLIRYGYSFDDMGFMANPGVFYRLSFNFWCREFQGQPEGLSDMAGWFQACFGTIGNEQYCIIESIRDVTYDWMKMKACYIADQEEPQASSVPELPSRPRPELSKESLDKLRTKKEEMQADIAKDKQRKDQVLEIIKQKNEKKGILEKGGGDTCRYSK